jgi:hypothetical protein
MSAEDSIQALLAGLATADPEEWRRKSARIAWSLATTAAWSRAMRAMDVRCQAAVDHLSDEEFQQLFAAEQAKVDAIRAPLVAVEEEDRWPEHLYFGGV